jgi:hypothetical protein
MTKRLKLLIAGLLLTIAVLCFIVGRQTRIIQVQKQTIVDLIGLTLQYDNALRGCQNPVSLHHAHYHPR